MRQRKSLCHNVRSHTAQLRSNAAQQRNTKNKIIVLSFMVPWADWAPMGQLGSSSTALRHQQELQPSRGHQARVSKSGALVGTDGSQGSAGMAEMGWDFSSFLIVSWHLLFHVVSPHGLYCGMAVIIIDTYQLSSQECRSIFQALISLRLRIGIFYATSYLSL